MSLSQTVVHLAERLRPLAGEKYGYIVDVLVTLPHWVQVRDVTHWEDACVEAAEKPWPPGIGWSDLEAHDARLYLLMMIYDLGCCNLYTSYDEKRTRAEYQDVIAAFRKHNIPGERPASEEELSCW